MFHTSIKDSRSLCAVATTAAILGLTACGGSDGDSGDDELQELNVGVLSFADLAPFYMADEEGIFEEHGLDVSIQETASGVAQLPSLISGEIDINYGSYISLMQAVDQGLPLAVIRENNRPGSQGIHVAEDSDIESVQDLEGATIAVNALGSVQELTSRAVLDHHDVDPASVSFVELPPPEMPSALDLGNVEAAWLVEPFVTTSTGSGTSREITSAWDGPTAEMPVAGWASSQEFVAENPEAVASFNAALEEAMQLAEDDPQLMAEVIPEYTDIEPEVAEQVAENTSITSGNELEDLEIVSDLMLEHDFIDEAIDVDELIVREDELNH